ncbi:alpha/beta fold hydrolase [Streptomyces sp. NBC_01808]|uniref:alpha/beta fold hydrolase n=1 Tax=Streptomyces sp. NBC_01808 TaxID=2975947 RepID=UPI002DD90E57|nr:alpha/beta fold hydrolase [Streptomyces sp. NBC_01808]WSA40373.1 alpha/beta fold hydrolase [Streptomyces sp. NBC_01808]
MEDIVFRSIRSIRSNGTATALVWLCCTAAGAGLVGCSDSSDDADADAAGGASAAAQERTADEDLLTGTEKIDVGGQSVNVSCSGSPAEGRPVVVLLSGGGDDLTKLAGIQKTLSAEDRVCSYDRLGQGASDKPAGPQTIESTGKVLTGVIEQVAGDRPVVLAGHSLGGLISARYAPDHTDRVKGLVLMDATSPTQNADLAREIPDSATGPAVELREQTLAILGGKGPEKLTVTDGEVRSAGDIPVEVIRHGKEYLATVPEYGPGLERAWLGGQRKWLALSERSELSTAENSEHYIYADEPEVAVRAIRKVTDQAARG